VQKRQQGTTRAVCMHLLGTYFMVLCGVLVLDTVAFGIDEVITLISLRTAM